MRVVGNNGAELELDIHEEININLYEGALIISFNDGTGVNIHSDRTYSTWKNNLLIEEGAIFNFGEVE